MEMTEADLYNLSASKGTSPKDVAKLAELELKIDFLIKHFHLTREYQRYLKKIKS